MYRKIFYFLLILSFMPGLVDAQTKGRVRGKVLDLQTGEPLIGANVVVIGTAYGAATDANGEFLLLNLDPGAYDLKASYLGYQSVMIKGLRISSDITLYQDFELPSEDVTVATIEITAQRPLVQKDNTNAVRITSSEDIEALPVRGVNQILSLQAGVSLSNNNIYIRGGREDEVGYYLEGVSVTNPIAGGRAVTLSQDALEEIQVQAGGYPAEFGGANAGIVKQSLKSGGSLLTGSFEYITDNITFKSKEDAYDGKKRLGAHWWGYNEMSGVISGPILSDKVKFFLNLSYIFNRDDVNYRNHSRYNFPGADLGVVTDPITNETIDFTVPAGPREKNTNDTYSLAGTVNLDLNPFRIRLSGTFSSVRNDVGAFGITNITNDRIGQQDQENGAFSIKATHVISPDLFYEISAGYFLMNSETYDRALGANYWAYGDSVANARAGWVWERSAADVTNRNFGRYVVPTPISFFEESFARQGTVPVNYSKFSRHGVNINGGISLLIGKIHTIKAGFDFQKFEMRNWSTNRATTALANNVDEYLKLRPTSPLDSARISSLINGGVSNYGYDLFGKHYEGDGFYAPHRPTFLGIYLQDKIEYEDLILNVGLRFDYIDIDNLTLKDPSNPSLSINKNNRALIPSGWVKTDPFQGVSPRIGLSFPITDKTVFHAQFGKFVQQPQLGDAYAGYHFIAYMLTTGFFFGNPIGNDIRPTRTTQYELGFNQQLTDYIAVDVTGYYKDIKDQVVFITQNVTGTSGFTGFSYYQNTDGDFATTKGLEIALTMRRNNRLSMNAVLAFQDARGTGSFPNSNRGIEGSPIDGQVFRPQYVSPLEFNNGIRANLNLDYRFGSNDGPSFLHDFGASLLVAYNSGRPYTRGAPTGDVGQAGITAPGSGDARFRLAVEPLGASLTPSNFQMDLRLDKSFTIFDRLKANVYIFVLNLLDTRNPQNVYVVTGSSNDDGYLSDPETVQSIERRYGESTPAFMEVYKAVNVENDGRMFGDSRQIRLGIRLEY